MEALGVVSADHKMEMDTAMFEAESIDVKEVTEHFQKLCFIGKHLKNENDCLNIAGSPISVKHSNSGPTMQVYVKAAQIGKIFVLNVEETDPVYYVKEKIYEKESIPRSQQTVMYKRKCLEDSAYLGPYNINMGITLNVVFRKGDATQLFQIFVKLPNEETIGIEVEHWYTIDSIMDTIQKMTGVQKDQQVLVFRENLLENCQSLADCDIQKGAVLNLLLNIEICGKSSSLTGKGHNDDENQRMEIFVRNHKGNTILLSVLTTDTIWDVKAKIEEKENIPPEFQKLRYGGMRLEDEQTLADYDIQKESTLTLELLAAIPPVRMMEQNYLSSLSEF